MKAKTKRISGTKLAVILSSTAIMVSAAAIAHTTLSVNGLVKDDALQFKIRQFQYMKIKFCFEHDIKPCTNLSLDRWNRTHPDNKFNLNIEQY